MTKKDKTKENGVYLAGKASEEVTGSMYLVTFDGHKILLECGLWQSNKNGLLDAYKVNNAPFPFNPKDIEWIVLNHPHIDHSGLIPRLYKEGCTARIITTEKTARIAEPLWFNSAYILEKEASRLSRQTGRVYQPIYSKSDVEKALSFIDYYNEYDKIYYLDRDVRFQWLLNGHCVGATQVQLILGNNGDTKKILYTSDMGTIKPVNHYVTKTEIPNFYNDIVLMETTYGDPERKAKRKREGDLAELKGIINKAISKNGSVLMPCFSFAKTQEIMTELYLMFKDDPEFKTKIYLNSMLTVDICKVYNDLFKNEQKELWDQVYKWDHFVYVREYEESMQLLADKHAKIIISSSGFMTNGRVVDHAKQEVKNENSSIVITGYPGSNDTYLAYRLLNHKDDKKIKIDGIDYAYNASIYTLGSVSSHIDFDGLVEYGGQVRTNKLVLVHGDLDVKEQLKPYIVQRRSKNNLTNSVIVGKQGMFLPL